MTNLPIFQTPDRTLSLLQTSWKAALTPILQNEINQGLLISADLIIGDIDAAAQIYRSAELNDKTLVLTSDAICTVQIWMF